MNTNMSSVMDGTDDTKSERENLISQVAIAAIREIATKAIEGILEHATHTRHIAKNAPLTWNRDE